MFVFGWTLYYSHLAAIFASMELPAFKELFERLLVAGSCLSNAQANSALRLADVLKRFSRKQVERVVAANPKEPASMMHMSDGWGAWCNTHVRQQIPGTHLVCTRAGKFRHEFFLQRALLRQRQVDGTEKLILVVGDPEGLNEGKGAWNAYTGSVRFMRTLRELGHTGLCANVYLVDGALFQSLARKFKAHHALYYELLECDADEKTLLEMQEFTFCFKCVSHGCSNGTKWGLKIVATESSIVEDAHIATASCMNCSTKFHSHIGIFLRQYLRFVARRSGSDNDIRAFWLALGVEAEMA
jgi:hypothetical protein